VKGYRILIGDLVTNSIYEELTVTRLSFSHVLNGPGKCDISTSPNPQSSALADKIKASNIQPGRGVIYIEKDGVIVWAGILWEVFVVYPAHRLRLIGEGFWSYFRRRIVRNTVTFTDRDQHYIAKSLIDTAIAETGGSIAGLSTAATNVTSGVEVSRTYYDYNRSQVSTLIENLADRQNGFDFGFTSEWDKTTSPNSVSNGFQCYYPKKGTINETVLDIDSNLTRIQWQQKGQKFTNKVYMVGAGTGVDSLLTELTDISSISDGYPLLEHKLAKKEISSTATLTEYNEQELQQRKRVYELLTVETNPKSPETRVGAFTTGDIVTVRASRGYLDLDKYYRIMAYDVYLNQDSNDERISIQLSTVEATE